MQYTWVSFKVMVALGVRVAMRSEHAIRAATTKATVVKKPNTFWARTMVECIVADSPLCEGSVWVEW